MTETSEIPYFCASVDSTRKERHAYIKLTYHYACQFNDIYGSIKRVVKEQYGEETEFISNPDSIFEREYQQKIMREGFMPFLACSLSMESVLSKSLSVDRIEEIIRAFLNYVELSKSLLIIDPYFFSSNNPDCDYGLFLRCIPENVTGIEKFTVVYNGKNKNDSINVFRRKINEKFHGATIDPYINEEFHDRFWINTLNKTGVLIGTSLNGIGKKISVIDRLSSDDVEEILKEVKNRIPNAL